MLDRWREHSQKPDPRNAASQVSTLVFHDRRRSAGGSCRRAARARRRGSNAYTVTRCRRRRECRRRHAGAPAGHRARPAARRARMLVERMVAPEDRARVSQCSTTPRLEGHGARHRVRARALARPTATSPRSTSSSAPDPVKAWLGEAGVKVAETVLAAGPGDPAVEGQGAASSRSTTAIPGARPGGRSTRPAARCR